IARTFGNDSFELQLASMGKYSRTIPLDMRRVDQRTSRRFLQQGFQTLFSLLERARPQVLAIKIQEIEEVIAEFTRALRKGVLQRSEVRMTLGIRDRDLTVKKRRLARELR